MVYEVGLCGTGVPWIIFLVIRLELLLQEGGGIKPYCIYNVKFPTLLGLEAL